MIRWSLPTPSVLIVFCPEYKWMGQGHSRTQRIHWEPMVHPGLISWNELLHSLSERYRIVGAHRPEYCSRFQGSIAYSIPESLKCLLDTTFSVPHMAVLWSRLGSRVLLRAIESVYSSRRGTDKASVMRFHPQRSSRRGSPQG